LPPERGCSRATRNGKCAAQLFLLIEQEQGFREQVGIAVRFQKKMQPVSLEIPEPGATAYQNLMRQSPI
jgi:hypothetical protein